MTGTKDSTSCVFTKNFPEKPSDEEEEEDPIESSDGLIRPLCLCNSLVDQFAAGESFAGAMPVRDSCLAQLPAEQHRVSINFAGKIQQSGIEVFDLYPDGINFSHSVLDAVNCFLPLGLTRGHLNDIDQEASAEEYPMRQLLEFEINGFDQFLALNGSAQKRFKNGQQRLSFFESKGSV
jgi:hypothetical protein